MRSVTFVVNGHRVESDVEARTTLGDFLRVDCALTGTHLGCEHGVCGACTVLLDGDPARSCQLFAAQCEGAAVTTVEGLTPPDGTLSVAQQAFRKAHGVQCGFCTPGSSVTVAALLADNRSPDRR